MSDPSYGDGMTGMNSNQIGMRGPSSMGAGAYTPNYGVTGPLQPTSGAARRRGPAGRRTRPTRIAIRRGGVVSPPMATAGQIGPAKSPTEPPWDPAEIVAHVGSEVIQACEVLPSINQHMEALIQQNKAAFDQLPPDAREEQMKELQKMLMKKYLEDMIKYKVLLSEVHRKVPAEGLKKNEEMIRKHFNANEIKQLQDQYKATSVIDLDNKLRKLGSRSKRSASCTSSATWRSAGCRRR